MPKSVSQIEKCAGCPLRKLLPNAPFVSPQYGTSSRIAIGDHPEKEDALQGKPFVSGYGDWLDALYGKAGIKRDSLTILNCVQCRLPDGEFPTDSTSLSKEDARQAVSHCYKAHVEPVLTSRDWNRVDLLGERALNIVGQIPAGGIYDWRGVPLKVPAIDSEKYVGVSTFHPRDIAKNQTMSGVVVNDLKRPIQIPKESYVLYPTLEQVKAFTATEFAFDIETPYAGHPWEKESIKMVGLSAKTGEALVVPFRGAYVEELRRIFRAARILVAHNGLQFDLPVLQKFEVLPSNDTTVFDTMLMQHLRFPDLPHDLEFVASQFISKPLWKFDKAILELYNARDTDVTWQIYRELRPMIEQAGLMDLYKYVTVPLAKICFEMQKTGVKLDSSQLTKVREKLLVQMGELEKDLPEEMRTYYVTKRKRLDAPPGTVNAKGKPLRFVYKEIQEAKVPWRSSSKKQEYLYHSDESWQLGLPEQIDPKKKTVTTNKVALDKLKKRVGESPHMKGLRGDPRQQVEHRIQKSLSALKKLNNLDESITTFCKEEMINVPRLHTNFNVHGTSTGRLSSSDPNLQNIPEDTRAIYVPSHRGWKILSVDFSGIENRLTAWFAGDLHRQKRLAEPEFSEHKYLAGLIEGIPYEQVKKDKDPDSAYSKAKHVTHGSDRGMGALKMSQMYDMDLKEVKRLLALWKAEIIETIKWQERNAEQAKQQGFLANPFGRKLWFFTSSYYTESISFVPQSTAADVIFRAMIGLYWQRINWPEDLVRRVVQVYKPLPEPARMLLQVHDELVFEYPEEMEREVISTVKTVMEQRWPELGGMSLPISISTGLSWGEIESYKEAA